MMVMQLSNKLRLIQERLKFLCVPLRFVHVASRLGSSSIIDSRE